MKWWMWPSLAAVLAVAVALFVGKDDIVRVTRMHRM